MTSTTTDGRHDFDFLHGSWTIHNTKLADMADPACDTWVEFGATGACGPVLGGLGNTDSFSVPRTPDGGSLEAMTLRLFDPASGVWRIWWASSAAAGHLDPPVEGGFTDGHGVFRGTDVVGGQPVQVRFDWIVVDGDSARWEQSFSFDDGATWLHNWTMAFTRVGSGPAAG